MMQIGVMLREAREEQDLTLDHIQELTKIQKRYLVAIEQDDFHALPGRFYARAFIKEYAQAVGLDPELVLEGFDEESIQSDEEETVPYTRFDRSRRTEEKRSSLFSFLPTVIVVILVIGIIFVAYTLMQKSSSSDDENPAAPQEDEIIRKKDGDQKPATENEETEDEEDTTEDKENEADKENDGNQFEVVEVGEGNSPLSTIDFLYEGEEVLLQLNPTAETYVQILNSNEQTIFEGSLTEGTEVDELDISDEERIYLNIGNAPALTVTINGKELEYPVNENERVHQKIWINLKTAD